MKRNYLRESQCEFKNTGTTSLNLYRPRTALFFSNQKNTSEESVELSKLIRIADIGFTNSSCQVSNNICIGKAHKLRQNSLFGSQSQKLTRYRGKANSSLIKKKLVTNSKEGEPLKLCQINQMFPESLIKDSKLNMRYKSKKLNLLQGKINRKLKAEECAKVGRTNNFWKALSQNFVTVIGTKLL